MNLNLTSFQAPRPHLFVPKMNFLSHLRLRVEYASQQTRTLSYLTPSLVPVLTGP